MFNNPEFYPEGAVAFVPRENLTIYRFGESIVEDRNTGEIYRTPDDFRRAFPEGEAPSFSSDRYRWVNNAWFNTDPEDGDVDDPFFELWPANMMIPLNPDYPLE